VFRILRGPGWSIAAVCTVLVTVLVSCDGPAAVSPASAPATSPAGGAARSPDATTRDRVPDLVILPLEAFHLGYQDGRKGLRFSGLVENIGDGPFDVTGVRATTKTDLKVTENVFQTTGAVRHVPTKAVMRYAVKDGHEHFHIRNFALYRMRPVGSTTWRVAHKEGFCFSDDADLGGTTTFHYPDDCGYEEPNSLRVNEGLSVGWVDDYDWTLPGQFFDLTGLRLPGDFCVAATADPSGLLMEKTRSNNSTSSLVHITRTAVSVVRQGC
jgi:hypothetical protein